MSLHTRVLALSVLSPLIVLVIHMAAARVSRNPSRQKVALGSIIFGYVPLLLLLYVPVCGAMPGVSEALRAGAYCLIVYSCLAYTYFHFFNMSETSRRIRILHEIYAKGLLPVDNIPVLYKTSDVVHLRFKRLVEMGQLKYEGGLYSIDGRILYIAAVVVSSWRTLLRFPDNTGSGK